MFLAFSDLCKNAIVASPILSLNGYSVACPLCIYYPKRNTWGVWVGTAALRRKFAVSWKIDKTFSVLEDRSTIRSLFLGKICAVKCKWLLTRALGPVAGGWSICVLMKASNYRNSLLGQGLKRYISTYLGNISRIPCTHTADLWGSHVDEIVTSVQYAAFRLNVCWRIN